MLPDRPLRCSPRLVAAAFVLLSAPPRPAAAGFGDPEIRAGFSGGYVCQADTRRYHGIGGAATAGYAFGPTWAVGARYGLSAHAIRERAFQVHQLGVGGRYQLDVFEYVPWIELSPGLYVTSGDRGAAEATDAGVRFGLGFDRLLDERISLSVGAHYHQLFDASRYPALLEIQVGVGFRWGLGDPLAP
jgi:hypothetical protein